MSDEATPHDEVPEGNCDVPGCCYHSMLNAKVRATTIDGETFIHVADAAMWLLNWHASESHSMRDEIAQAPEALRPLMLTALANHINGATVVLETLNAMATMPIAPDLTNTNSPLVTPEAMKAVPDSVPAEWVKQTETQ